MRPYSSVNIHARCLILLDTVRGAVIGYGSVEESGDDPSWFRMLVCLANDRLADPVSDDLHAKLWCDLHDLGASGAWAREWATLTEVADYFVRLGYAETRRYSSGGRQVIVWKKPISEVAR